MNKLIALAILLTLCFCKQAEPPVVEIDDENLTPEKIDSILLEYNFTYENPVFLKNSKQVLIPISTDLLEARKYSVRDSYSYDIEEPRYWNILFYNTETGGTRLLTDKKWSISNFDANLEETGPILARSIIYQITTRDYNRDGKLNELDAEHLFISDLDGANLHQLSPAKEDFASYEVIPETDQLIIKTIRNTDDKPEFNSDDEFIWYKAELKQGTWHTVEIIDSMKRKNIANLYFEKWLKKKRKD
ncbi:MAG: hypothetical protein SFV55_15945 [Haliscomenobacter sp.]|uniref:hypothetical protein n=1 Tax=Haliscomenobacter sp. TaxID=2717303 RepID=UPI0029B186A0|nr:hypothetical protein [Haliscomenobacter sp.]MDX2069922.1 hypothetical protein [Haliscomenobacter sp.]